MSVLQVSQDTLDLQNNIISLKIALAKAIEKREFLNCTVKPSIESEFQLKIGVFQIESMQLELESRRLKAVISRIQADINHNKKPDIKKIEKDLNKEFKNWYKEIEAEAEKIEKAKDRINNQLSDAESEEFKKLFRECVKKLHPDINPDLGDEKKKLWLQVIQAYKCGDLGELRILSVMLESENENETTSSNMDDLQSQLISLQAHLEKVENDIEVIQKGHPFDLEKQLNDKNWVRTKQAEIKESIEQWKQVIPTYVDIIETLLGYKITTILD